MRKAEIKRFSFETSLEDVTLNFGTEANSPSTHPAILSPANRKRSASRDGRSVDADKMFGSDDSASMLSCELEEINLAGEKSPVKKIKSSNLAFQEK